MTNDAKDADQPANDPADPANQPVAAASPSAEEVKRKFREALDRKHAHGGRDVSEGGEHAKIHDAHGPAKAQQMFRRKSGS